MNTKQEWTKFKDELPEIWRDIKIESFEGIPDEDYMCFEKMHGGLHSYQWQYIYTRSEVIASKIDAIKEFLQWPEFSYLLDQDYMKKIIINYQKHLESKP